MQLDSDQLPSSDKKISDLIPIAVAQLTHTSKSTTCLDVLQVPIFLSHLDQNALSYTTSPRSASSELPLPGYPLEQLPINVYLS